MTQTHDNKVKDDSELISIEPAILTSVKIKNVEKTIISPNLIPTDIEVPVYVKKEQIEFVNEQRVQIELVNEEKFQTEFITEQCEQIEYITKEEPTVKYIPKEEPTVKYIPKEEPTVKYVKKEVPYEFPVVSMEQVNKLASDLTKVLTDAKIMMDSLNEAKADLVKSIAEVKESIPKEIIMPNIIYEDHTVKNVTIEEETVTVIGKIVARGK